jgi:hypothetical protein
MKWFIQSILLDLLSAVKVGPDSMQKHERFLVGVFLSILMNIDHIGYWNGKMNVKNSGGRAY